jgi:hypothetical protein
MDATMPEQDEQLSEFFYSDAFEYVAAPAAEVHTPLSGDTPAYWEELLRPVKEANADMAAREAMEREADARWEREREQQCEAEARARHAFSCPVPAELSPYLPGIQHAGQERLVSIPIPYYSGIPQARSKGRVAAGRVQKTPARRAGAGLALAVCDRATVTVWEPAAARVDPPAVPAPAPTAPARAVAPTAPAVRQQVLCAQGTHRQTVAGTPILKTQVPGNRQGQRSGWPQALKHHHGRCQKFEPGASNGCVAECLIRRDFPQSWEKWNNQRFMVEWKPARPDRPAQEVVSGIFVFGKNKANCAHNFVVLGEVIPGQEGLNRKRKTVHRVEA